MKDTVEGTGSCLCGDVEIAVMNMSIHVGSCHCGICRNWGGGPMMAIDCGTSVELSGENKISIFESSEWAERAFCSRCGTHLFYRLKENNQYFIPAGLFDDQSLFQFDHQVFIDKKPSYYSFANDTKDMTEEEVFSSYSA